MKISKSLKKVISRAVSDANYEWSEYERLVQAAHLNGCKTREEVKAFLAQRHYSSFLGLGRDFYIEREIFRAIEGYRSPKSEV